MPPPSRHVNPSSATSITSSGDLNSGSNDDVVRLRPYNYVHVHDGNKNVTRLIVGPCTYTRLEHEHFATQPEAFVSIPPCHYCIIENPIATTKEKKPIVEESGQVKNRFGYKEIRKDCAPFPLFPGEVMYKSVTPLTVLTPLEALRVTATASFAETEGDEKGKQRNAGDEWLIRGPVTVVPHVDVQVVEKIVAVSVSETQHLILKAERDFVDREGKKRIAGEQWLYSTPGSFIPAIEEKIFGKQDAIVLTEQRAIHVRAVKGFIDRFKKERRTGDEWLVTVSMQPTFMPSPDEQVFNSHVSLTVMSKGQYAIVQHPIDKESGAPRYGSRELRVGPASFFLHPFEKLEILRNEYVLGKDEGLVLTCDKKFKDQHAGGIERQPGDKWMIKGPVSYIPPVEVRVITKKKAMPLDQGEGIYIRDTKSGKIRAHIGSTVLLNENEELWKKELPPLVEELLTRPRYTKHLKQSEALTVPPRQKHKVVVINVPHNHFIQVYNYTSKKARVIRGPERVTLAPDEDFTVISLSGSTPKQSDIIKTLCMFSGPDFATDKLIVETRDHARLKLHLSYNWEFDLNVEGIEEKMFCVPDFIGDMCKTIASKIRAAVASEPFDQFHLHSNKIIKEAVFGESNEDGDDKSSNDSDDSSSEDDEEGKKSKEAASAAAGGGGDVLSPTITAGLRQNSRLLFEPNGLIVTGVDIHSVDPVDQKTSEALTKSVQLAIEITTSSQQADARHQAQSLEQAAKGKLQRSIIEDQRLAEFEVQKLKALECENSVIESKGASVAESRARADAAEIECQSEVDIAQKHVSAASIVANAELEVYKKRRELEVTHKSNMIQLQIAKSKGMATVEAEKFSKIIKAVGKETITNIAKSGPETQARLLKGLGLQGYLVTDGKNPINLMNTAAGMTAGGANIGRQ